MNQENPAASEGWPEDKIDWPHAAVGVAQDVVYPELDHRLKSVFCICSSDGKSAYIDVFSNGKLELRGDLPTDEAAEIFMKEMGESIQDLQDRQVLQKQLDELLKQRDELRTVLEEAIEYLEPGLHKAAQVGVESAVTTESGNLYVKCGAACVNACEMVRNLAKQRNALMTAAKALQQHGFFEQSSCASDEQNAAMQTMREAIAQVEGVDCAAFDALTQPRHFK